MPKDTEYIKYTKNTNCKRKLLKLSGTKRLQIRVQKTANCKKSIEKNERKWKTNTNCKMQTLDHWVAQRGCRSELTNCKKTKNTTNTKCKMQTLDRWVAQRGCRPEAGSRASLLPCRGAQFGLATLWERFSELFS